MSSTAVTSRAPWQWWRGSVAKLQASFNAELSFQTPQGPATWTSEYRLEGWIAWLAKLNTLVPPRVFTILPAAEQRELVQAILFLGEHYHKASDLPTLDIDLNATTKTGPPAGFARILLILSVASILRTVAGNNESSFLYVAGSTVRYWRKLVLGHANENAWLTWGRVKQAKYLQELDSARQKLANMPQPTRQSALFKFTILYPGVFPMLSPVLVGALSACLAAGVCAGTTEPTTDQHSLFLLRRQGFIRSSISWCQSPQLPMFVDRHLAQSLSGSPYLLLLQQTVRNNKTNNNPVMLAIERARRDAQQTASMSSLGTHPLSYRQARIYEQAAASHRSF